MVAMIYDGTFEGFLTAVFETYEYKYINVQLTIKEKAQPNIFGNYHNVLADEKKAARVWDGLKKKISLAALTQLYKTFLSELDGIENTMLNYIKYVFQSKFTVEYDYSNEFVLAIKQT